MKRLFSLFIASVLLFCTVTAYGAVGAEPAYEAPVQTEELVSTGAEPTASTPDEAAPQVPQIRVTTKDHNGTSLQKSDGYVDAQITITDTDGTTLSDSCSFKVRGNSTAMTHIDKKPFTFKFSKKKDVLGMGKGKKWALLANAMDPTLLRNYLSFELAYELGITYTSQQRYVELWVDDLYRGCYTLYEPVQEGKDRVNIDIESSNGMKDFLLELESTRVEDDETYLNVGDMRFIISEPDEPNDDQIAYISGIMDGIVSVLKTGTREEIEQVIDLDSFTKFYLLNEYLKNMDFDMSSVFFYYQDGKLYAGPPWDYDLATGNLNAELNSNRARKAEKTDGIIQNKHLYRWLCSKPWFNEAVKLLYEQHADYFENIAADGGQMDSIYEQYKDVFARNFGVWRVSRWYLNYQKKPLPTYEENYSFLKNWLSERHRWLSEHFDLFSREFLRGDADGNGEVALPDVTAIQRVIVKQDTDPDGMLKRRSAVTGEELSSVDATVLQRYLAQMGNPYALDEKVKIYLK